MEMLNLILSFPGKILAFFITQQLEILGILFFGSGLYLIQYGIILQNKRISGLGLIFISLLFSFLPFIFGAGSLHAPLFWIGITVSMGLGAFFYRIHGDFLGGPSEGISGTPAGRVEENMDGDSEKGRPFAERKHLLAFLILITVLGFYFRTFQIEQFPPGYSFWELDNSYDVVKYDNGELGFNDYKKLWGIKEVGLASHSPILMGLSYPFFKVFGISLVTGRYFSIFLAIAGLIFLLLYLRTQFSFKASVFLMVFVCLGLVHIAFSRAGLQNITAFFYGTLVLWMMEVLIRPRRMLWTVFCGMGFGAILFGSLYMYLATRAFILTAVLILGLKAVFKKNFFKENFTALWVSGVTLFVFLYTYVDGNLTDLWPKYATYINPEKNPSYFSFFLSAFKTLADNIDPVLDRIIFSLRSVDSLSQFSQGGLVVEPVLCLVPFALGYLAAGAMKQIRYSSLIIILCTTILPAILSGVPNARRLLIFLSFFLIVPGITLFIQHELISGIFHSRKKNMAYLISGALVIGLFSHNLFIYLDIYKNMRKQTSVTMPFAESGFMDIRYSPFLAQIAKEMKRLVKDSDIFYYYSNVYDENATAPNGAPEQFIIETYENRKNRGRLVWMNQLYEGYQPFRNPNKSHFFGLGEAIKMIQTSSRNVAVFFIKPLGDERAIYDQLAKIYPEGEGSEIRGEGPQDVYLEFSIKKNQINQKAGLDPEKDVKPFDKVFSPGRLKDRIEEALRGGLLFKESFLVQEDSEIIFKHFSPGVLDVFINGRKLEKDFEKITLFKGIHVLEVKPSDQDPFSFLKVVSSGSRELEGLRFLPPPDLDFIFNKETEEYGLRWVVKKRDQLKTPIDPHTIFMNPDGSYWYSDYGVLRDPGRTPQIEGDYRTITNIRQRDQRIFVSRTSLLDIGWLTLYDPEFNKLKDFQTNPYPFDMFFDSGGGLFITHIGDPRILVYSVDGTVEYWDTSPFSAYPIWNGTVDKNGDFILLSAGGEVFILDSERRVRRRFYVDTTWRTFHAAIRDPGGLIVLNGVIHILDGWENTVKSYSKTGKRLYNRGETSLVGVPKDFKIDFIQELNGKMLLISRNFGGQYLVLEPEKYSPEKMQLSQRSLTEWKPASYEVGWGDLQINEKGSLYQTIGGEKFDQFVFAHAPSRVVYFLGGDFRGFSFGFGLDDVNQQDKGSVRFIVNGDGKNLFTSSMVGSMAPIVRKKIDVTGIVNLELIADPTNDGNANDEAVWVNPVLEY